jgi:hypothetical protein
LCQKINLTTGDRIERKQAGHDCKRLGSWREEISTDDGQTIDPTGFGLTVTGADRWNVNMVRTVIGIIGSDRSVAR